MNARVMLAGGGTGGHLFPMMAVAQELQAMLPDVKLCFVGTERGIEARAIPKAGYPLETLTVRPLKGGGVLGLLRGLVALPQALGQALSLVRQWKPDVVVSAGGYAAGPVTLAAAMLGVPTALMEQNALPGLTNRILGHVVKRCFLSLPVTPGSLPEARSALVGNPVRTSILERVASVDMSTDTRDRSVEFHLLVTGGSGGAGPLNEHLPVLFRQMDDDLASRLCIKHQAGRGRHEAVVDAYRGFAGKVEVVEFIEDMAGAYFWADIVLGRAGATTLAELLLLGQPSVLVPFPGAADNHQEKNAEALVHSGAAVMIRQRELLSQDPEQRGRLERLLRGFVNNPASLDQIGAAARALGKPEAGQLVARGLLALAKVSGGGEHG